MDTDVFMAVDYAYLHEFVPREWPDGMLALCPQVVFDTVRIPEELSIVYKPSRNVRIAKDPLGWARKGVMYRSYGVISTAVWAAFVMGSRIVRMVGIDGGGGYKVDFQGNKSAVASPDSRYRKLRANALDLAARLGIMVELYDPRWKFREALS